MTGSRTLTPFTMAVLTTLAVAGLCLCLCMGGCGSEQDAVEPDNTSSGMPAEEIMAYRNVVEGELEQPVEGQLQGEVMAAAAAPDSEESWMLLRVDSYRPMGSQGSPDSPGSISVPGGSEVSIRYRETAETETFSPGDILSIHVRIMKSKDGPVLVARDWSVIGGE